MFLSLLGEGGNVLAPRKQKESTMATLQSSLWTPQAIIVEASSQLPPNNNFWIVSSMAGNLHPSFSSFLQCSSQDPPTAPTSSPSSTSPPDSTSFPWCHHCHIQ
ncbi:hypothetical protein ILYODFUR_023602 [Ilyodon furcidens]|uniref:Uncharacterized protein n=1 Tax=Ilyodon furcidens TaxID=33524 RepID=A0ABV0T1S1_9TELE